MVMSMIDAKTLAEMLEREKLVILPYAEYQSLLDQARTLQDIRDRLQASVGQPSAPSGAATLWAEWRDQMGTWIDERPGYSASERQDLKDQIGKIQAECEQGAALDTSRLEKLINTLAVIGPDVFEVATATLVNPLAGIGVALKKIGDRARLERKAQVA
jgi:hypothetical protein